MPAIKLPTKLRQELEITIETALVLAGPDTTVPMLAKRIFESEKTLIEQIGPIWITERLTWLLYRNQSRKAPWSQNQLRLPGFEDLPRMATLKDGKRPLLIQCTLKQLREYRTILMKNRKLKIKSLDRLIALVGEHARDQPTITVGEVMEKLKA